MRPTESFTGGLLAGLVFGLLLSVAAAGQARGPEEILPVLADLRQDVWKPDAAVEAIGVLVTKGELAAAGWWLEEARRAVRAGRLPGSTRRALGALETRLDTAGLLPVEIGKIVAAPPGMERVVSRGHLTRGAVSFGTIEDSLVLIPIVKAIRGWFDELDVPLTCIRAPASAAAYLVLIPARQ